MVPSIAFPIEVEGVETVDRISHQSVPVVAPDAALKITAADTSQLPGVKVIDPQLTAVFVVESVPARVVWIRCPISPVVGALPVVSPGIWPTLPLTNPRLVANVAGLNSVALLAATTSPAPG